MSAGDHFWDPKSMKIVRPKHQKTQTDARQCDFGETRVLTVFGWRKNCFLAPRVVEIIVGSRPGSAKKSKKMMLGCSVDAVWCLGVPPDPFFDEFQSDLGCFLLFFGPLFVCFSELLFGTPSA